MRWKEVAQLKAAAFKRMVGVQRNTFDKMLSEIRKFSLPSKHKIPGNKRGPKPKLCKEDELLMLLMYYREYRTFFHIGADYGVSEAQCWRIITGTEKLLMQSGQFHLPGKKKLVAVIICIKPARYKSIGKRR